LAQKGVAAGIPGEQVDGNDVVAVRAVVGAAVERARRGEGPSLIEALTYRLGDHTTADDASRYRSDAEVSEHWKEDPVARLRAHLVERGLWGREQEEALLAECGAVIDAAIAEYEAIEPLPPEAIFEHLYATLPEALRAQRDEVIALTRGSDDAHG
jgi:pyruvate dehydrogenase E1 component alpha subunit